MSRRGVAVAAALAAVAALGFATATALLGDDGGGKPSAGARPASGGSTGRARVPPVRASAAVRDVAASLPLEARVAQLLLVGFEGTDATAPLFASLRERGWGGVVLGPDNLLLPESLGVLAGEAVLAATAAGRLPPLVVADALPAFPAQRGVTSAAGAAAAAREAASSLAAAGVDAALAPQADLAVPAGPAEREGFSDRPRLVARAARGAVAGWLSGGVLPMVGHFPGQGAASQDPLEGPSIVGGEPEVRAFRAALRRAPAVVVSNAAYTAYDSVTPAALLPAVVRDLLRREMRFKGLAVTDDLAGAAAATGGTAGAAAVQALRAGADMVQVRGEESREAVFSAVLRAARSKRIPPARLREALLRVLVVKERAGRLEGSAG